MHEKEIPRDRLTRVCWCTRHEHATRRVWLEVRRIDRHAIILKLVGWSFIIIGRSKMMSN